MDAQAPELTALLRTLSDGEWHSGERLAAEAGCTRAGLAKRVARLRERYALTVEAQTGRGYRLATPIDLLDEAAIRAHLDAPIEGVTVLPSVDSTNRWLLDAPSTADPHLCVAEHQTAGRGRRGRAWASPFGQSLYLSLSWRFDHPADALGALPLAIGCVCCQTLEALGAQGLALKWPNDLVTEHGKLGGLLIEARGEMGGSFRVVIGLGLNLRRHAGLDGLDQPAIALSECLNDAALPSRNMLCAGLATALAQGCQRFNSDGLPPFRAVFDAHDALRDRAIVVHDAAQWTGIARGVDRNGALRVEDEDGQLHLVHAGDVSVRRA